MWCACLTFVQCSSSWWSLVCRMAHSHTLTHTYTIRGIELMATVYAIDKESIILSYSWQCKITTQIKALCENKRVPDQMWYRPVQFHTKNVKYFFKIYTCKPLSICVMIFLSIFSRFLFPLFLVTESFANYLLFIDVCSNKASWTTEIRSTID